MSTNSENAVEDIAATTITVPAEGEVLHPYQDPGGIWTIGTGSIWDLAGNRVTAQTPPITAADNLTLLHREMHDAFTTVEKDVTVPLTFDEEAALVDFVFNLGAGNFEVSTLLKDLRAKNYGLAADQFLLWNHAGGQVLAGLTKRCAARRALFLQPDPATPAATS